MAEVGAISSPHGYNLTVRSNRRSATECVHRGVAVTPRRKCLSVPWRNVTGSTKRPHDGSEQA